jgi:hypothetical protein
MYPVISTYADTISLVLKYLCRKQEGFIFYPIKYK